MSLPPASPLRGISLKILSVLVYTAMAVLIKAASERVPPGETMLFRSLFALPVILLWLVWRREFPHNLRMANPMGHVWRGVLGSVSMGLSFAALGLLPLPEVTALGYAAPILTVMFAAMFLGEDVRGMRLAAVALGLVGVLIVLSPRLGALDEVGAVETLGATVALMAAVFVALTMVTLRRLVATETTASIVFWFSVMGSLLSLVTLPFGWVLPTPQEAALLVSAGILGGIGQILMTSAYRHADASIIAPFEYVSMIFALVFGYVLFDEAASPQMLGGAALVIAAGVLIIWSERRRGRRKARGG